MPTAKVPVKRFREHNIRNDADFLRVFGPALEARGFRLEGERFRDGRVELVYPLSKTRTDEELIVTQEPPGRVANNNPSVYPLLQRMGRGDATAANELLGVLLAAGDDRAATLSKIEVSMPEETLFYADSYSASPDSDVVVTGEEMAAWQMCSKVLLLMGCREEAL